jgi:Ca2+-binding RTX toxin-like protein
MSGAGSDIAIGGRGNDLFVLETGKGVDQIRDFSRGADKLGLMEGTRFNRLTIEQVKGGTLVSLGNDELAFLRGVNATLRQRDFTTVVTNG